MRSQTKRSDQPADSNDAPLDARPRVERVRLPIEDEKEKENQLADSNGAPLDARPRVKHVPPTKEEQDQLSEISEEGKLGLRERHFDVDRIMEEAAERRLNRSITFERLSEAFGTRDTDFVWGVTQQLIDAGANFHHGDAIGFLLSVIRDIKPRDHVERLLAAQMSLTHLAMMHFTDELAPVPSAPINIPRRDSAARTLTSLARTFTMQMSALKHHRGGGEQRVTVRHVSVSDGGQAIVGNVDHRAPVPENTPNAAPALTDARQAAMEPIKEVKVARVRR